MLRWRLAHHLNTVPAPRWNRVRVRLEEQLRTRVPVVVSRGVVDGETVTFAYAGSREGLRYIHPYLEECLFHGTVPERSRHDVRAGQLHRTLDGIAPDLVIVAGTSRFVRRRHEGHRSVLMPFRIHQVVDTTGGWDAVQNRISRRERRRHEAWSEQFAYTCTPSLDPGDYFAFYDHMVRPSMERRYGDRDRSLGREQGYHTIFRRGILFLVRSRELAVAGSTCEIVPRRRLINARLIGVLDGDPRLRREGAQNAVYHFILQWACANGIGHVDFQGCEPFLCKGTFQYKKRFATRAVLPPNKLHGLRLAFQTRRDSPVIRDLLVANPVMVIDDQDRLGAGYFYDDQRPPRLDIPYEAEGFEYRALIHLNEHLAGAAG